MPTKKFQFTQVSDLEWESQRASQMLKMQNPTVSAKRVRGVGREGGKNTASQMLDKAVKWSICDAHWRKVVNLRN